MPAKSKKQYQFMKAVAENKKFADKVGVPQSVGKEFTKVKKYDKGGQLKYATKNEKLYDKLPKEYKDMYSFGEFVKLPDFEKAVLRSSPEGRDVKIPERARSVKPAPKKGNPAAVMKKKEGGKVDKELIRAGSKIAGAKAPKQKTFLEAAGDAVKNAKAIPDIQKQRQKQKAKYKNEDLDRLIEQKTRIDRVKYGKKKGGKIGMGMTKNNYKKGGSVKCKRDGICVRGKTKGRMV